jgi:hypothetical protein
MAIFTTLLIVGVGSAVGAATYGIAKKRKVTTGTAAAAGVATGAGSALVAGIALAALPYVLVGAGAYGIYQLVKGDEPKALPPGSSD